MVRKIELRISEDELSKDLEKYRQRAISLGATDAKIVTTSVIQVDERVTLKCRIPTCFGYGTSANCPPHTITPSEMRGLIQRYDHAIFLKLAVRPEEPRTNLERIPGELDIRNPVASPEGQLQVLIDEFLNPYRGIAVLG